MLPFRFLPMSRVALLATALLFTAPPLRAEEPALVLALDLPAQPLGDTLIEIGTRYRVVLSFSPVLVQPLRAPTLAGRLTLAEALAQALRGSRLAARRDAAGTWFVVAAAETGETDTTAPSVRIDSAEATPPSIVLLDKVVMTAARFDDQGLAASYAQSATRTGTALVDLPQAVSVLTRDSLSLQGEPTVAEAMRFVAGAGSPTNTGGRLYLDAPIYVRGLRALPTISGMRTLRSVSTLEGAFAERIEVVKGPNGSVGGAADWGGRGALVNMELKRPGSGAGNVQITSLDTRDGGTLRTITDLESALGGDLSGRLVAQGKRTGTTDGGYDPAHAAGLLGALRWKTREVEALVTVLADRRRDVPTASTHVIPTSIDAPLTDERAAFAPGRATPASRADGRESRGSLIDTDWRLRLNEDWRVRLLWRSERMDSNIQQHLVERHFDGTEVNRNTYANRLGLNSTQIDLIGRAETGPVSHELLFAIDHDAWREHRPKRFDAWFFDDAYLPGVTPLPDDVAEVLAMTLNSRGRQVGAVFQDQAEWGPMKARVSLRRGRYRVVESIDDEPPYDYGLQTLNSWDIGIAWQASSTLTLYVGQQRSFEVSTLLALNNQAVVPMRIQQEQAGLKLALDDRRALLTLEWYRVSDRGDLSQHFGDERVELRSARGFEVEFVGRAAAWLQLSAGLEFARYVGLRYDNGVQQPFEFIFVRSTDGIPRRAARLLAEAQLPAWIAGSSRLGLGLVAQSQREIAPAGTNDLVRGPIVLPGSARMDLSWTRDFGPHSLRFVITNVADRRLFGGYGSGTFVPLEPQRAFTVVLRSRF